LKFGDFSELAGAYSESRPKYSPRVLKTLIEVSNLNSNSIVIDLGAGTGIWTRMLRENFEGKIIAVEPNIEMLQMGIKDSKNLEIDWINSTAEEFEYARSSVDLITMASSFHWANYDKAISNFKSLLKPGGYFCALWNTRAYELHPKLQLIEEHLKSKLKAPRISSGRSNFTDVLLSKLSESFGMENCIYQESFHQEEMTVERYIRIWQSVNDVQVQLGREEFDKFIEFIEKTFVGESVFYATYQTRAWVAQKPMN
jgi:ubiquinone/menaquinone biosynthesis C-methylase UbiE